MGCSEEEKIEYKEANALLRHYHTLQWVSGTVFIPAAFAILGLTWEVKECITLVFFAFLSIWLYAVWYVIQHRYQDFVDVAQKRIWELEKRACLHLHLQIKQKDIERMKEKPISTTLRKMSNFSLYVMPISLVVLWVARIFIAKHL